MGATRRPTKCRTLLEGLVQWERPTRSPSSGPVARLWPPAREDTPAAGGPPRGHRDVQGRGQRKGDGTVSRDVPARVEDSWSDGLNVRIARYGCRIRDIRAVGSFADGPARPRHERGLPIKYLGNFSEIPASHVGRPRPAWRTLDDVARARHPPEPPVPGVAHLGARLPVRRDPGHRGRLLTHRRECRPGWGRETFRSWCRPRERGRCRPGRAGRAGSAAARSSPSSGPP